MPLALNLFDLGISQFSSLPKPEQDKLYNTTIELYEYIISALIGADMNHASDYYATINNALKISSYTRINGRIGLEQQDGPWSAILSGTNLTDKEDLFSGIAGSGTNIRTPQPPRMYMFTVNYRY